SICNVDHANGTVKEMKPKMALKQRVRFSRTSQNQRIPCHPEPDWETNGLFMANAVTHFSFSSQAFDHLAIVDKFHLLLDFGNGRHWLEGNFHRMNRRLHSRRHPIRRMLPNAKRSSGFDKARLSCAIAWRNH